MELFSLAAVLITLAALFSYLNHRFIGLPTTIGVMLIALLLSMLILIAGSWGFADLEAKAERLLGAVDFDETVMYGMLSFLLFAGALHININDLARQKWVIISLATVGVLTSTVLVGTMAWAVLHLLGFEFPYLHCLLFGALISPTDPIAVMAILKTVGIGKTLETKIAGESLFNDGVGVVVFLVLLGLATNPDQITLEGALLLFAEEALGGVLMGLALGYAGYWLLRGVDNYQVEILLTLALVMGGYALAMGLHTSGPIAIVVAGLFIGNRGRRLAMSDRTREHLDLFWELMDEILNAVLFVLIGLEVLVLPFSPAVLLAGLLMVPLVLSARFVSVGIPIAVMRLWRDFSPNVIKIMVWCGVRGGISVALALSLPPGAERDVFVAMTYVIVVFSIIGQGLTVAPVVRRLGRAAR